MDAVPGSEPHAQLDDDNPWPGLASYDERSHGFFAGRSAECDELFRRISDEPVTVLFGKSGLGKTSLLKAGVFPRLRERGLLPVPVRVLVRSDAGPFIAQVSRALFDALRSQLVDHPEPRPGQSLWEYLHLYGLELWTRQNRLVRPVFVFDQFEELFTLGKAVPAQVATFAEDLADLAENRIPADLASRLEAGALNEGELDLQAMPYKLVLTLREDFLPDLEGLRLTMPSLRRNRMRLLPMGREQALEAVRNPHTERLVPEPIAASIVEFLGAGAETASADPRADATLTVEPALLSLFCRGVNEHRKEAGKPAFDEALLEGGKESIVADFYRTSLRDQPERVRRFVEDELITEQGFRNSYSVEDAVKQGALTAGELATLVDRRLLRLDHYLGVERVELTHDILTKAVREERARRREVERARDARQRRNRLFARWGGLAALGVVAFATGAWLLTQRSAAAEARTKAEAEAQLARSQAYAVRAESALDRDPALALLLAQKGLALADTPETRAAVLRVAEYVWPEFALSERELGGNPVTLAISPDGVRVGVIAERELSLWDVSATAPRKLWTAPRDWANVLAFSPQGQSVAVGRSRGIALYSAATGERVRPDLPLASEPRVLAFSPGGEWLAAAGADGSDTTGATGGGLLLWQLKSADMKPVRVAFDGAELIEIAVADDEAQVLLGLSSELTPYRVDRGANGRLEKLDVTKCLSPRVVSLGGSRVSATFKATTCQYGAPLSEPGPIEAEPDLPLHDLAVDDVVWSAGGKAFLATVPPLGMVIGSRDGERRVRLRGLGLRDLQNARYGIALDEKAARVALIDDQGSVRVYTLERSLPYMNRLTHPGTSIAPGGRWMAAWSTQGGRSKVEAIPLEEGAPSWSLDVSSMVLEAIAANDFMVYGMQGSGGAETHVVDVRSRKERIVPTWVEVLGRERELLFAGSYKEPWIERLKDGEKIAWKRCEFGTTSALVSQNRSAFATLCDQAPGGRLRTLTSYAVRGEELVELGKVRDLAAESHLKLADGGRSVLETLVPAQDSGETLRRVRRIDRAASVSASDATQSAATKSAASPQTNEETESPLGGYVVRQAGSMSDATFEVWAKSGKLVTSLPRARDPGYAFSGDEGRLAVWSGNELQVFDLSGEVKRIVNMRFDDVDVRSALFEAGDKIASVRLSSLESLLVPLDTALIQRFAAQLIGPRTLTPDERCVNGDASCNGKRAPAPASSARSGAALDQEP